MAAVLWPGTDLVIDTVAACGAVRAAAAPPAIGPLGGRVPDSPGESGRLDGQQRTPAFSGTGAADLSCTAVRLLTNARANSMAPVRASAAPTPTATASNGLS